MHNVRSLTVLLAMAVVVAVALVAGCAGFQFQPVTSEPCTIYADFGATPDNSVIASKIANPCTAQRLLGTATKVAMIWDTKNVGRFQKWSGTLESAVTTGGSYQSLQGLIEFEVVKLNKEAGMTLVVLADGLFVFGQTPEIIRPVDQKLLLASLNDLRKQVANLALIARIPVK